jgi:hypothetical protein
MKIIEVQFDGHVKVPHAMRGTNVIRVNNDVHVGESVLVDSIEEKPNGVFVVKRVEKDGNAVTYRKLYAWHCVNEVKYEPEVVKLPLLEEPRVPRK